MSIQRLEQYIKTLHLVDTNNIVPLKSQSYIPAMIDTLSRKHHPHITLSNVLSTLLCFTILDNIAAELQQEALPRTLKKAYFCYFDLAQFITEQNKFHAAQLLCLLREKVSPDYSRIILAIPDIAGWTHEIIMPFLADDTWRFIIINSRQHIAKSLTESTCFSMLEPTNAESLAMLKTHRAALEDFHQVLVPDESFVYALSLATHYLSNQASYLDKTLQLIDSAAARASAIEQHGNSAQIKPIVTPHIIANVVSSWTNISLSHLQQHKLKASDFIQHMQQHIFGQETAIDLIGPTLQYARMKLHQKPGPLCNFLFSGPSHVGKTAMAYAIAEQLFGHHDALLHIHLDKTQQTTSLADIRVTTQGTHLYRQLHEALQQRPYAIVLIENINQAPLGFIDLFHDAFTTGYCIDKAGNHYDFRHAIFIVTTTIGAENMVSLMAPTPTSPATQPDLMQLILNEPMHSSFAQHHLSPQELSEGILPALMNYFSPSLLEHFTVIPFVPLDASAIEKIIRLKLNLFTKKLHHHFGIELHYVPEVVRFLIEETLWREKQPQSIDKILNQHLYCYVTQELLSHIENKNKPKRLLLQLNDAGLLLRCEFIAAAETVLY